MMGNILVSLSLLFFFTAYSYAVDPKETPLPPLSFETASSDDVRVIEKELKQPLSQEDVDAQPVLDYFNKSPSFACEVQGEANVFRNLFRKIVGELRSSPPKQFSKYLKLAEPLAKKLLAKGQGGPDPKLLEEVALRYPLTASAQTALLLLLNRQLNRADFSSALPYANSLASFYVSTIHSDTLVILHGLFAAFVQEKKASRDKLQIRLNDPTQFAGGGEEERSLVEKQIQKLDMLLEFVKMRRVEVLEAELKKRPSAFSVAKQNAWQDQAMKTLKAQFAAPPRAVTAEHPLQPQDPSFNFTSLAFSTKAEDQAHYLRLLRLGFIELPFGTECSNVNPKKEVLEGGEDHTAWLRLLRPAESTAEFQFSKYLILHAKVEIAMQIASKYESQETKLLPVIFERMGLDNSSVFPWMNFIRDYISTRSLADNAPEILKLLETGNEEYIGLNHILRIIRPYSSDMDNWVVKQLKGKNLFLINSFLVSSEFESPTLEKSIEKLLTHSDLTTRTNAILHLARNYGRDEAAIREGVNELLKTGTRTSEALTAAITLCECYGKFVETNWFFEVSQGDDREVLGHLAACLLEKQPKNKELQDQVSSLARMPKVHKDTVLFAYRKLEPNKERILDLAQILELDSNADLTTHSETFWNAILVVAPWSKKTGEDFSPLEKALEVKLKSIRYAAQSISILHAVKLATKADIDQFFSFFKDPEFSKLGFGLKAAFFRAGAEVAPTDPRLEAAFKKEFWISESGSYVLDDIFSTNPDVNSYQKEMIEAFKRSPQQTLTGFSYLNKSRSFALYSLLADQIVEGVTKASASYLGLLDRRWEVPKEGISSIHELASKIVSAYFKTEDRVEKARLAEALARLQTCSAKDADRVHKMVQEQQNNEVRLVLERAAKTLGKKPSNTLQEMSKIQFLLMSMVVANPKSDVEALFKEIHETTANYDYLDPVELYAGTKLLASNLAGAASAQLKADEAENLFLKQKETTETGRAIRLMALSLLPTVSASTQALLKDEKNKGFAIFQFERELENSTKAPVAERAERLLSYMSQFVEKEISYEMFRFLTDILTSHMAADPSLTVALLDKLELGAEPAGHYIGIAIGEFTVTDPVIQRLPQAEKTKLAKKLLQLVYQAPPTSVLAGFQFFAAELDRKLVFGVL